MLDLYGKVCYIYYTSKGVLFLCAKNDLVREAKIFQK